MVMISTAAVAGRGSHNHGYRSGGVNDSSAIIETTAIDSETAENLVFMYQEEKVARDTTGSGSMETASKIPYTIAIRIIL